MACKILQLVSIVFDNKGLNMFYDEVAPATSERKNIKKKHLTIVLVNNPTEEQIAILYEIESEAIRFISNNRVLGLSVIRDIGCDVLGVFNKFYWQINNKYAVKLGITNIGEPHVSF